MSRSDGRISNRARALVLAIALFLGLPALNMVWTDDAKRADWENRSLASFPAVWSSPPETPGFFARLDDWIDDHFGLALPLNRLYRKLVFYVFRDSPAPQITFGRDGFVFLNTHQASHPNAAFRALCETTADSPEGAAVEAAWIQLLEHFEASGRRTVLGIAPTKPAVYPDRLGGTVPRPIREACLAYPSASSPLTRLMRSAEKRGLQVIYPLDAFIAHRDDDNFYPRQSFHFSGQSAGLFAQTLMREVGIDPGPLDTAPRYEGEIKADLKEVFGFNRYIRAIQTDDSAFGLQIGYRQPESITSCYARALDFGTYETANPLTERAAILLSDSFGSFTATQLAPAYRRLTWINISDLQADEGRRFVSDCLEQIPAEDLFFVVHDGGALWIGPHLRRAMLAPN